MRGGYSAPTTDRLTSWPSWRSAHATPCDSLSYEFENLDGRTIEGVWCCGQGSNAYIWMREQAAYWEPFRVTSNRPSRDELDERDAVAIRGRVDFGSSERMRVSFTNIGQFFVPQGDGNPPAPPDVRLVIDGDGSARVRGLQIDGAAWP